MKTSFKLQKLPVLEALIQQIGTENLNFNDILFVCVQHLLYTTYSLLESIVSMGAKPDNIHIMGKPYSSCPEVANKLIVQGFRYYPNLKQEKLGCFSEYFNHDITYMWKCIDSDLAHKNIKKIIILDDGGKCILSTPLNITNKYNVISIEQTASGLKSPYLNYLNFPIIEVATTSAKQLLESPFIADAVIKNLVATLPLNSPRKLSCAVIGLGVIGLAIVNKLVLLGHPIITYDKNPKKNRIIKHTCNAKNINEAILKADYIFGCTGEDITEHLELDSIKKDKYFISCSSQDTEFLTLLRTIQNQYIYNDILGHISYVAGNGCKIKIYRGGFPINFDNSGESVASQDIQLTRGLLLGGILQAALLNSKNNLYETKRYMLHPYIQQHVTTTWKNYASIYLLPRQLLNNFNDLNWIQKNSGGLYVKNGQIEKLFANKVFQFAQPRTYIS